MSSMYGESVKFYEKMSDLHGQLKGYEDEQYNLQEELGRLWIRPSSKPAFDQVDKSCAVAQVSRASQMKLPSPESKTMTTSRKVDDVNEEEQRRQRNQIILEKIKELESNAAVFAARSEKLRIMKSEYETLVKKYMGGRNKLSNINMYSSSGNNTYGSQPSLPTSNNKMLERPQLLLQPPSAPKPLLVSTGVNTSISGPIRPLLAGESQETFRTSAATPTSAPAAYYYEKNLSSQLFHGRDQETTNGSSVNNNSHVQYKLADFSGENKTELYNLNQSSRLEEFYRSSAPENIPTISATHPIENKFQGTTMLNLSPEINQPRTNHHSPQNLNEIKPSNVSFSEGIQEGGQQEQLMSQIREPDSLNEKLRHNLYFDLSTTSDSDLTSAAAGKAATGKKKMLPININLDDTTQSDTFSLSMHVPTRLSSAAPHKGRRQVLPAHVLNLALTSEDASDSTTTTAPPHLRHIGRQAVQQQQQKEKEKEKEKEKNKKPEIKREGKVPKELTTSLINEEREEEVRDDLDKDPNLVVRGERLNSLPGNNDDNDNELELFTDSEEDSLTTSPGDSVMDSVQNRTLNESIPVDLSQGGDDDDEEEDDDDDDEEIKVDDLLPSSQRAPPGASAPGVFIQNQQKAGIDVFRVPASKDNLINETYSATEQGHGRLEKEFTPLIPTNPKSNSINPLSSVTAGPSQNRADDLVGMQSKKEVIEENAADILAPDLQNDTPNAVEVLNTFTKIEAEFTIDSKDTFVDLQTWEQNTVAMVQTKSATTTAAFKKEQQKPEELGQGTKGKAPELQEERLGNQSRPATVNSVDSTRSNQPSRASASTVGSSAVGARRVKIKLDYEDSDSEVSEAPKKEKPKSEQKTVASNNEAAKKDEGLDDDFDDFFDI